MSVELLIKTDIDITLLAANSGYQHLVAILRQLDYQLTLTDNQQKAVCGMIYSDASGTDTDLAIATLCVTNLTINSALENFLVQLMAVFKLNQLQVSLNKGQLIQFHSHYKLLLLAYSQPLYRQIGPFVASIKQLTPEVFTQYRHKLMEILRCGSNKKDHANVLQHIQGYFRPYLTATEKQSLVENIDLYRLGEKPLLPIIELLKHYLAIYPNSYLSSQYYLMDYPILLHACYGAETCVRK